jgi:hypothetical protein
MLRKASIGAAVTAGLTLFGLALDGPPSAAADTITLTPRSIQVGKWAEGIVFDGSSLWVAESGQRTIAQVNVAQGNVTRRVTVGRLPTKMVLGRDGAVYALIATDNVLWQQFPNTGQGKQLGGLDCYPQDMAAGEQSLWVLAWVGPGCDSSASRLIKVDPRGGGRTSSGLLGGTGQAYAVAVNRGKAWVVHTGGQPLSVVDEQSLSIQKANVAGGAFLTTISFSAGSAVYVGGNYGSPNGSQGLVASIDPATLKESRRQIVDQPIAVMADDDRHLVAVGAKGKIFVFSSNGLELQRTIELPSIRFTPEAGAGPKSALIRGDEIYISNGQQSGENGAVLILSGWRPAAIPAPPPSQQSTQVPAPSQQPSPTPVPPAATDCPYQVVSVGDATGIWMYQDPDTSAPHVVAVPGDAKGLVADRCLTTWCHVTFRGQSRWVQRSHIQATCN